MGAPEPGAEWDGSRVGQWMERSQGRRVWMGERGVVRGVL